jgi:gluconolactonase
MAGSNPLYEHHDKAFGRLVSGNEGLETLYDKCRWAEGPVWFGDGQYLLWSDIPNNRIMRWTYGAGVSVFRTPAGNTNGHTRDRQGRLISCSHGNRHVERTEHDGSITVLATEHDGKRLNSPNDVVVKSDGTIWFTDPAYGIESDLEGHKSKQEQAGCYVYCIDPKSGKVTAKVTDMDRPNGLAFSPDESILYVADSASSFGPDCPHHIRQYKVGAGNKLSGGKVFVEINPGLPDGFRVDTAGNIWTSAGDGVHVYNSSGTLLGKILIPKAVANVTFGGPKKNWLFICGTDSVYLLHTKANGAQQP